MRLQEQKIRDLIEQDRLGVFYTGTEWRKTSDKVIKIDHGECVLCKARGRATTTNLLAHHVTHLKDRPDLAYTITMPDGTRNIITVCKACHENVCHPERLRENSKGKELLTTERWD